MKNGVLEIIECKEFRLLIHRLNAKAYNGDTKIYFKCNVTVFNN